MATGFPPTGPGRRTLATLDTQGVATSTNRIELLEVSGADAADAEHRCGNVRDGREVALS
jgi:hypothetical protein